MGPADRWRMSLPLWLLAAALNPGDQAEPFSSRPGQQSIHPCVKFSSDTVKRLRMLPEVADLLCQSPGHGTIGNERSTNSREFGDVSIDQQARNSEPCRLENDQSLRVRCGREREHVCVGVDRAEVLAAHRAPERDRVFQLESHDRLAQRSLSVPPTDNGQRGRYAAGTAEGNRRQEVFEALLWRSRPT